MDRITALVSGKGVDQPAEQAWAHEIRDYLLGRISSKFTTGIIKEPKTSELANLPIRRWWVFEGKQYRVLEGSLAKNLEHVIRSARRLDGTFNPLLRLSNRADGVVDWGQTLARGPGWGGQEYVVRSSGIGLDEAEHAALWGWMGWIAEEWDAYKNLVDDEITVQWSHVTRDKRPFTHEQLRRWAHTARRSRWPLLRSVVAESLRPTLEPEEIDRLPLPNDRAKLFELLCLVRIANCVAPPPSELRWLNPDIDNNRIALQGVCIHYQQSLQRDSVLATSEYAGPLALAVRFFNLRIPKYIDLAFDFEKVSAGFDGLIVEAKSGSQQYTETVAQLRTYRLARPRRPGSRYIIWGIVEKPDQPDPTASDLRRMLADSDNTNDLWVFSSADGIPVILATMLAGGSSFTS
jgi:hypothetical protein